MWKTAKSVAAGLRALEVGESAKVSHSSGSEELAKLSFPALLFLVPARLLFADAQRRPSHGSRHPAPTSSAAAP
jgi:hypothetical protein